MSNTLSRDVRKILWDNIKPNQGGSWFDIDTALEAILALLKKSPIDLNELSFKCDHCGEILIPQVDENNDEEILIEPCDCLSDVEYT